ncbi:type I-U CRISPR-associated RAMP protein Csb1/Cas7u [Streptomyces sp. TRM75563]|uniref:type I-G CRISPR-associated RAMP protein Csb1/Cas7g n=1 Tax=Streptomyces sp. TRM75563 TaxID=2817418 RepID=UPI001F61317B|nr:type I-U CRISPR-associated RAMP protein Csb1/Cas7u [Streptomyces sp. TRM75563]MCI4039800.1 type I-U CRISPR-associated RAMP protein Csb1/Cas7u [Streptomyces sp. TRM75563]
MIEELYERLLAAASAQSEDSAIRVQAAYEPTDGLGGRIFPPTVKSRATDAAGYLIEPRYVDGVEVRVVLLDQRQSQANRCEQALLDAVRRQDLFLPHLELSTEAEGRAVRITSLEAPHRSRDAYFRDAEDDEGAKFDETEAGAALCRAGAGDLGAYLRQVPTDLVYGVWDSHRKRRIQVKVPRAYTSEMYGVSPLMGVRAAGRVDRLNLAGDTVAVTEAGWSPLDGAKPPRGVASARMSELGHGMIPPSEGIGGVSVKAVRRQATISLAQLSSLRFGDVSEEFAAAGRALLASIALLGDRLAFGSSALHLRSGCDLVVVSEQVAWVRRGQDGAPVTQPMECTTVRDALALFELALERARKTGLEWPIEPVRVRPNASLQQAIAKSFEVAGIGAVGEE